MGQDTTIGFGDTFVVIGRNKSSRPVGIARPCTGLCMSVQPICGQGDLVWRRQYDGWIAFLQPRLHFEQMQIILCPDLIY